MPRWVLPPDPDRWGIGPLSRRVLQGPRPPRIRGGRGHFHGPAFPWSESPASAQGRCCRPGMGRLRRSGLCGRRSPDLAPIRTIAGLSPAAATPLFCFQPRGQKIGAVVVAAAPAAAAAQASIGGDRQGGHRVHGLICRKLKSRWAGLSMARLGAIAAAPKRFFFCPLPCSPASVSVHRE